MLRSNWHNNWLLVTFEKFVYFFIPAWVGKTLLKIGPTFTDFAFKRSKRFVNDKNDDSEASKKIQDHQFWKKNQEVRCLRYLGTIFCHIVSRKLSFFLNLEIVTNSNMYLVLNFLKIQFILTYRISSYSFRPWIVSSLE